MPPRRTRFAAEPNIVHRQEVAAHEQRQQEMRHAANRRIAMEAAIQARQDQAEAGDAGGRVLHLDPAAVAGLGIGPGGAARFGIQPIARPPVARADDNNNAARNARNAAARYYRDLPAMGHRGPPEDDDPYLYVAHRAAVMNMPIPALGRFGDGIYDGAQHQAMLRRAYELVDRHNPYAYAVMQAERQQSVEESWSGINFTPRHNPLLGFTYDFDKDAEDDKEPTEIVRLDFDDESPIIEELKAPVAGSSKHLGRHDSMSSVEGKGKGITSLVCAKCNEQLRVSQGQRTEADRVFALRCGHLIDKRCLDDISQPHSDLESNKDDEMNPGFVKMGKGKAAESTSRNGGRFVVKGSYVASTTTPQASSSTLPRIVSPHADQQSSSPSVPLSNSEAGGSNRRIPSRTTRSAARAAAVHPDNENHEVPASDDEAYDTLTNPNGRLPSGRKRKVQPKAASKSAALKRLKAPVEMREFRWVCPVAACGKEHFSEEIGGVWKPKDGMTVQLFV
ncbi:hypothetical protein QFC21_004410 [Naganishia friedmannii]|uniref:Uncharacterized protein n=1 Tax=Naganishia friedmannii TaxID=89922 RepID=A0ACC2VJP4_9TREE|nr:hypothetical protein QFC21_004410 [Naganishia friedmannii]